MKPYTDIRTSSHYIGIAGVIPLRSGFSLTSLWIHVRYKGMSLMRGLPLTTIVIRDNPRYNAGDDYC